MRQRANEHQTRSPALAFVTIRRRTGVLLALAVLTMPLAGACGSGSPPTSPASPSSSTGESLPQPPPAPTRYHLSGRVTTDAGSPITGALVEVDHGCPTIGNFCWLKTLTNGNGEYAMEFEAGPMRDNRIGYIYSFANGYETNIQWVPPGSAILVQNLHLRSIRMIRAGESTSVSVDPASSLCTDLEDWWVLGNRCEVVQIEVSQAGTLVVDVRAAAGGSVVPLVFWATTGNYAGIIVRPGPSTVSFPVGSGTYRIFVGIPDGTATERFDVVTSLR